MGFLDDLFGGKGKSKECVPDTPVPFGYNSNWLCIKADSSEEVIEKLGLKNARQSGWKNALFKEIDGVGCEKVFVSPVLDGYVLVTNWGTDILTKNPARLDEVGTMFSEVHYFAIQDVVDYYMWVKFSGGKMVRGYCWCGESGEVLLNVGEPTSEETALGFTNFIPDSDANWDDYRIPEEDEVMQIAAAWGIDTPHIKKYPASTGFLCDI